MKQEEKDKYLDKWGTKCFICEAVVERKDMRLFKSIVELERFPEHADPQYIQYYMACPVCVAERKLI